ncbi:MAG: ATP-binding protein [bacterium]
MKKQTLFDESVSRESTELQISEIITSTIDSIRNFCTENSFTIEYRPPEQEQHVLANQDKLTQILKNLLFVVGKLTEEHGEILVEQNLLKGKRHNDMTDYIQISIRACSMDISKDMRELILEKFHRLGDFLHIDPQETPLFEFSSTKAIIKRFGGNFWVKSEPGNGLIFNFTIPIITIIKK